MNFYSFQISLVSKWLRKGLLNCALPLETRLFINYELSLKPVSVDITENLC
jgi:hypothetical protein